MGVDVLSWARYPCKDYVCAGKGVARLRGAIRAESWRYIQGLLASKDAHLTACPCWPKMPGGYPKLLWCP